MGPRGLLESSWSCPGSLEVSWRPLGALLERSWTPPGPFKQSWERLLAGPRAPWRPVSTILGAKRLPKRSPRGSKIESKRRSKLKTRILQKPRFFQWISLIFEAPGSLFGAKSGSKMRSESHLRRGSLQKASWKRLGALLDALRAEKTNLESLLGALGALLEPKTPPREPNRPPAPVKLLTHPAPPSLCTPSHYSPSGPPITSNHAESMLSGT